MQINIKNIKSSLIVALINIIAILILYYLSIDIKSCMFFVGVFDVIIYVLGLCDSETHNYSINEIINFKQDTFKYNSIKYKATYNEISLLIIGILLVLISNLI